MSRPVLYRIDAFDAGDSFTFTFSYSGNQVFSNQFVIRNNLTNAVVYSETISSMQLAHTVPKDTLVNGVCYNACVAVFDNNNIKSDFSEKIVFYCYSTPSLSFSNIDENQIIRNASYPIELSYLQSEGEVLNSYQIFLYNSLMQIVYQSGVKYDVSNLTGVIDQLEDNSAYFVRATGRTLHNMQADTGLVPISVEYESPALFALVGLENIKRTGEIKIASNIISIEGSSSPSPPVYMNNDFVDVRDMGAKVWFDKGFCASGDYRLRILGKSFAMPSVLAVLENEQDTVEIKCMKKINEGADDTFYFVLRAFNKVTCYVQMSEDIAVSAIDDMTEIIVEKRGAYYKISASTIGGDV